MITLLLSGFAGALSTLSPCVLPILPIVLSSATQTARLGPLALLSGVAISFTLIGTALALFGGSLGLAAAQVRVASALLMLLFGAAFLLPALQRAFVRLLTPLTDRAQSKLTDFRADSLGGQGLLGLLLGVAWSPCVGPTLGAAVTLAASGHDALSAMGTMLAFGVGAAVPMALLAYGSRAALGRRGRLAGVGQRGRQLMGWGLVAVALLVLTGADHLIETMLTRHMPDGLLNLVTRF